MPWDYNTHVIKYNMDNHKLIRDGVEIGTYDVSKYLPHSNNIYLFATNRVGNPDWYGAGRIYYLKIYDDDNLIRDFIPVIDEYDRVCLLDRLSKMCYYNQGTGEFLYG